MDGECSAGGAGSASMWSGFTNVLLVMGFSRPDAERAKEHGITDTEVAVEFLLSDAPVSPAPPAAATEAEPKRFRSGYSSRPIQDSFTQSDAELARALASLDVEMPKAPQGDEDFARALSMAHERPPTQDDADVAHRLSRSLAVEQTLCRKYFALGGCSYEEAEMLVQQALIAVGSEHSDDALEAAAFEWLLDHHNRSQVELELQCPVLLLDYPQSEMMVIDCSRSHTISYEAMYASLLAAYGFIPACPMANSGDACKRCNYSLRQQEVEEVLNGYARVQGSDFTFPAADVKKLGLCQGRLVEGGRGWISTHFATLYLREVQKNMGCIECPSAECGTFVQPPERLGRLRISCPKCKHPFCSHCKRLHHYSVSCDHILTLTRNWDEWKSTGRHDYLRRMAAEDTRYSAALKDYQKQQQKHERDQRDSAARWEDLQRDEEFKKQHCRLCPHCSRPIERMSGCDSMICGRDSEGGNHQNGCGKSFHWNQAKPYVPDVGQRPGVRAFASAEPATAARHQHFVAEGVPLNCDVCHEPVVGPLARCLHCPSHNVCIRCSDAGHDPRHVFALIMGDEPPPPSE